MSKLLAILISGLFALSGVAQSYSVTGKIGEKENVLPFASVVLLNKKDSGMVQFAITKEDGSFEMKGVKAGSYIFQSTYIGYSPTSKNIEVTGDKNMGTVLLEKSSVKLDQHEVVEDHIPIRINGDTVEYNAKAFKAEPNSDVEALLKKLPGVEVDKDGKVKAHGEDVQRILVDGKEFFGDDPKMATKNLPADAIDKIQVFDKESDMSEFTGISDGNDQKTINLKLKPDRKNGYFGEVTAGGGYSEATPNGRFTGKGNINQFSKTRQLSLVGMGNNLNEQGFGWDDYVSMMGGWQAMMASGADIGSSAMPMSWNPKNGLTTTWSGGMNLNTDLSKKTHLFVSYFYSQLDNNLESVSGKEYFNAEGNYNTTDLASNNSLVKGNKMNWKLRSKLDSSQDLTFRGTLKYNLADMDGQSIQRTTNIAGLLSNSSYNQNNGDGHDANLNAKLQWRKRFKKAGRTLVLEGNGLYGDNMQDGFVNNTNGILIADTASGFWINDTTMQDQDYKKEKYGYGGDVRFTEPIGKNKFLELRYTKQLTFTDLDKDYLDVDQESGTRTLNTLLSTNYLNVYTYDRAGVSLKINKGKKITGTIGAKVQYTKLNGEIRNLNSTINKYFFNVLPTARFRWRPKRGKTFRLTYNTRISEPTIEQLSPVVDNSNPLRVYIGNPDLLAAYVHTGRLNYYSFNQFAFTNTFVGVTSTYTTNQIRNQVIIDSNLVQYTKPVNVENDFTINGYGGFGAPIRPLKMKFQINESGGYYRRILFQNGVLNNSISYNTTTGLKLENRKKEVFDIAGGVRFTYNLTNFSGDVSPDQTYFSTNYYADLTLYFLKRWTFNFSADYTTYAGDAFAGTASFPILETSISRTFLKSERALVKLACYDVLNQNIGFSRNSNLNYIEESTVNTLGRHFVLTAAYSLKSFGAKAKRKGRRTHFRH